MFLQKSFGSPNLTFESSTHAYIAIFVVLKFPSFTLIPHVEVEILGCLLNPPPQKRIVEE